MRLKQVFLNQDCVLLFFFPVRGLYLFNSYSNMALSYYFFFFICLFFFYLLSFIFYTIPSFYRLFFHKSNSITGVKPGSIFGIFLWNFLSHSTFAFLVFPLPSLVFRTYILLVMAEILPTIFIRIQILKLNPRQQRTLQ